jgi:hypothetical protein
MKGTITGEIQPSLVLSCLAWRKTPMRAVAPLQEPAEHRGRPYVLLFPSAALPSVDTQASGKNNARSSAALTGRLRDISD